MTIFLGRYYSATIIQMAGVYNTTLAIWLSALTATTNFLCTFIGVYLVERAGRRMLTLVSLAGTPPIFTYLQLVMMSIFA